MFLTTHPPSSNVISLPFIYPILDSSSVPSATPPRPLQVYIRHPHIDTGPSVDSSPMASSFRTLILPSPADLPIAVRKGTCSSRNLHPIYKFPTYHCLFSPYSTFISTLSSVSLPKIVHARVEEMASLHSIGTWDLVTLPAGKSHVGCRWVYTFKIGQDGRVDHLKARLVAKGYT